MKPTICSIFLTLLIASTLFPPSSFSQDYTRWNLPEGAKVRIGKGSISELAYSPDGTQLAVATSIGIWVYNMKSHQGFPLTMEIGWVRGVTFSPDGETLASTTHRGIQLWDAATGKHKFTLTGHIGGPTDVAFSPNGRTLASGGTWKDKTIGLWDAATGRRKLTLTGHEGSISDIVFSPDGKTLITSESYPTKVIRLWDVVEGRHKRTLKGHKDSVYSLALSPDGRILASGSKDRTIRLWNLSDSNILLWDAVRGRHKRTLKGHTGHVNTLAFSPDGKTLISGSDLPLTEDTTIWLWDVGTGKKKGGLIGQGPVRSLSFSPDGRTFASGGTNGNILLCDALTGTHTGITIGGHTEASKSVAFSPDGLTLATSGGWVDNTNRLWDAVTGARQGAPNWTYGCGLESLV